MKWLLVAAAMFVVGCTGGDTVLDTSTSLLVGGDTSPDGAPTTIPGEGVTGTTVRNQAITEHRQVHSEDTDNGPVLHLVIPRSGYTEIDVESFIRDLRDAQPGLWGVELFDNADAQVAFMRPSDLRTEEQRTLVSRHHLVTLTEGELLIWRGPFSSLGRSTIGS